jgi:hypothetical protein
MFATTWSKRIATNAITGKKIASTLPATSSAASAIQTARHTSQLQPRPRKKICHSVLGGLYTRVPFRWRGRTRPAAGAHDERERRGAYRRAAGRQPIAGATCSAMVCSSRALYSTPSWLGTVSRSVSAACTAGSRASSEAMTSGSPA